MTVIGADRLMQKLRALPNLAVADITSALDDAAQSLKDDASTKINTGARGGRVYGDHRASAAGEYPKSRTGQLVASIFRRLEGLSASVGTGLDYGKFLEFGTSRMAARPWLRPSFYQILPAARNAVYAAMAKAIKQA